MSAPDDPTPQRPSRTFDVLTTALNECIKLLEAVRAKHEAEADALLVQVRALLDRLASWRERAPAEADRKATADAALRLQARVIQFVKGGAA